MRRGEEGRRGEERRGEELLYTYLPTYLPTLYIYTLPYSTLALLLLYFNYFFSYITPAGNILPRYLGTYIPTVTVIDLEF